MSGFPHNILHSQEDAPPRLAPIAQRGGPSSEGAGVTNPSSTSEAAPPGYSDVTVASPSREDYAASQFQYRPSSSSGDLAYRRDSGGSSAGSRPSTTASLNPTMQQLSTAERLPLSTTLPPLRSVMGIGRPASASESAGSPIAAANTLLTTSAWEQNRPRAASASSFTAGGSHRGTYLSGRYDRSILGRSALPDRYPAIGSAGAGTSSSLSSNPTLTWSGSLRSSRAGPTSRARSHSRPEPYVVPSGAAAMAGNSLAGPHRGHPSVLVSATPSSQVRAQTGLPGSSASSRGTGSSATPSLNLPPGETISLDGFSKEQDGRRFKLVVVQSPSRARMCGFGDKDRRPLSPTLIVKLVITDVETGKEVPPTDVDTSAFFLAADLVHPEELKASPRNLLIHQHAANVSTEMLQQSAGGSGTPSSSSSLATFDVERVRARSLSDPWRAAQVTPSWNGGGGGPGPAYHPSSSSSKEGLGPPHSSGGGGGGAAPFTTVTTETYTRNFVGASVASANILKDEHDQLGIFFVLQDLSVRTEGTYRIKLMFADLASPSSTASPSPSSSSGTQGQGQMRLGISEALAETYTEPFVVYTPRRFPGVIEPTVLSRKFAAQGVKIPVRVDRKKRRRKGKAGEGGEGGEGGVDGSGGEEGEGGEGGEGDGDEDIEED
ncbi:hypothetical protein BCV69DRAFT_298602 [Microstroma glucosiphilum]|uniref:Velvet domain-containing protein n=1 Tax=Pseudomicrostroma glucosiphilum TaxID=1684307 RepID=A0A316U8T9_9BASI|nr:hypothetical protein BCV69DRAFT_298602 [Pseudomicrostroma glucosiphilum]PWN21599.1 hypothetical protein BCV69DRAFT_298602 [Pseudomicrostroma glucosiphilum]